MKRLYLDGAGQVLLQDVPRPELRTNGVVTQTLYSAISVGTEGGWVREARRKPDTGSAGRATGYSNCGVVVEVGSDVGKPVRVGDLVTCGGLNMACHAEYCSVPRLMFASMPAGVDPVEAAFVTLATNAMHGVRQARITLGDYVVVLGTGFIGQVAAQLARLNGGRVLVLGRQNPRRLEVAARLGACRAILASGAEAVEAVLDYTDGVGADAVLICAASQDPQLLEHCLDMVRKNGRIVVVGLIELQIPYYEWHRKEAELLISRAYGPGRHELQYEQQGIDYPPHFVRWTLNRNMEELLRLLAEKRLDIRSLITHQFPLTEGPAAFTQILEHYEDTLSVVLQYEQPGDTGQS